VTKYIFKNTRNCTDSTACALDTQAKLELDFGIKLHADTETEDVTGHICIDHIDGDHKYKVFIYDTDGTHEGADLKDATIFTPNSRVKATVKTKPSLAQVEASV